MHSQDQPMDTLAGLNISRTEIAASHVASLVWQGDTLVDWVLGEKIFHMDGTTEPMKVVWAFPFDAACATPDGKYAVIYQRCGTKALLLRDNKVLRELNRSFYHAHVYEYPVCIWNTKDGRTLIAHCPDDYNRLEIEDADTGIRLTASNDRQPADFFHSRLMVNSDGSRLLSAGWFWHPWSAVIYYDIPEVLRDPRHLDTSNTGASMVNKMYLTEEGSACWQTTECVLLGGTTEENTEAARQTKIGKPCLHSRGIAVYDVPARRYLSSIILDKVPGTLMPIGQHHAVCFYEHPRLVSLQTGKTLAEWPDLETGKQESSILWETKLPPLVIDVRNRRFAVHCSGKITVIQIHLTE